MGCNEATAKTVLYRYFEYSDTNRDVIMGSNRYGEQSHPPFRNRRIYSENGQWYFDTREEKLFGPYRDKNEAEKELALFVAQSLYDLGNTGSDNNSHGHGAQDGIEPMVEELMGFIRFRNKYGDTATLVWGSRRLKELTENYKNIPNSKERIEALKYAMDFE
jgi:hypothetical protein